VFRVLPPNNGFASHGADISIDIAPSSIAVDRRKDWETALATDPGVSQYFLPPRDPAYHLEIPQDAT